MQLANDNDNDVDDDENNDDDNDDFDKYLEPLISEAVKQLGFLVFRGCRVNHGLVSLAPGDDEGDENDDGDVRCDVMTSRNFIRKMVL